MTSRPFKDANKIARKKCAHYSVYWYRYKPGGREAYRMCKRSSKVRMQETLIQELLHSDLLKYDNGKFSTSNICRTQYDNFKNF